MSSRNHPRESFRLYGTGLLLEIKRRNILYICNHIIEWDYQPMHYFMHDAPWDEAALNSQRIEILESNPPTRSCDDSYVIIDPKSGDSTFATRRQWMGCLGYALVRITAKSIANIQPQCNKVEIVTKGFAIIHTWIPD